MSLQLVPGFFPDPVFLKTTYDTHLQALMSLRREEIFLFLANKLRDKIREMNTQGITKTSIHLGLDLPVETLEGLREIAKLLGLTDMRTTLQRVDGSTILNALATALDATSPHYLFAIDNDTLTVSWTVPPTEPTPSTAHRMYERTPAGEAHSETFGPRWNCPEDLLDFVVRYPNRRQIQHMIANPGIYTERLLGVAKRALAGYDALVQEAVDKGWLKVVA